MDRDKRLEAAKEIERLERVMDAKRPVREKPKITGFVRQRVDKRPGYRQFILRLRFLSLTGATMAKLN